MTRYSTALAAILGATLVTVPAACATPAASVVAVTAPAAATQMIAEADVIAAQTAWGEALVKIARAHDEQGVDAARQIAADVLDSAYAYQFGPVLFKPTLTVAPQTFRTTREGALAYFVGGNPDFPTDTGFALKGWRDFAIENAAIHIEGNTALSMGNVMLTDSDGNVTTVDKTWGYARDADGALRIVLHHSSLPFAVD